MKRIITYLFIVLTSTLCAQNDETIRIKAAVDTFFEGFHKGDTTLMKSVIIDKMVLQTTFINKEGKHILVTEKPSELINVIAIRTNDQKWDERLLDYNIQIDGILAHVWTPYEFYVNGSLSHKGVNSFTLVNENDVWKIVHVIDTRHKG